MVLWVHLRCVPPPGGHLLTVRVDGEVGLDVVIVGLQEVHDGLCLYLRAAMGAPVH